MTKITIERETLERAVAALVYHQQQTRPIERTQIAIRELRAALAAQPAEQSMRPLPDHDNHHNALKCPYCNPRGLKFADPDAAPPAPAAVPLTRPHCRECAKWAKAQSDNKEWMDGVVRGREIVARLAAAENRMTDDLPPLSGLRPCLHQSPVP